MSKIEVNTIDTIAGSTTLTLGSTNATLITLDSGAQFSNVSGQNYPAFEAYRSTTNQSITDLVATKVEFDTEIFDTDGDYDNVTNYRFTPQVAGKYFVYSGLMMTTSTGTDNIRQINIDIRKNGSTLRLTQYYSQNQWTHLTAFVQGSISMNGSTDYLEVFVTTRSATGVTSDVQYSNQPSYFGGYRIGA